MNHRGFLRVTLGVETFYRFRLRWRRPLLAEMLEVLLLALDVLKYEARPLGLEVNWQKTKIQFTTDPATAPSSVHTVNWRQSSSFDSGGLDLCISGNPVDVIESFVYPGSEIHSNGSTEPEVIIRLWNMGPNKSFTRQGDDICLLRIENTGTIPWKPLRSSSGHACNDDDEWPWPFDRRTDPSYSW